ncbi:MAG: hypothetical protein IC227_03660 [Enterococcus lacertideformus]|uniref:Uncharacterized protein n=1 Tax=Enterococcus lacertideformus TaxID=2771493 RepID=A0A931AUN1_9ENTE|nr:hypothetical protein [Enterococcus lacertideformus]
MPQILLLELIKVFRNKRFIVFTIIIPIIFFLILSNLEKGNNDVQLLLICTLYGMIGNNVVTMSTRIAKERNFYENLYKTTRVSMIKGIQIQAELQLFSLSSALF